MHFARKTLNHVLLVRFIKAFRTNYRKLRGKEKT